MAAVYAAFASHPMVAGALPGVKGRLSALDDLVPLPFIEGSHLAGSLVGTALLLMVPTFADWPLALRVCVSTLIFTPIMVFWVLPWVTKTLRPWLLRTPHTRRR